MVLGGKTKPSLHYNGLEKWSSRKVHCLEIAGSNPASVTNMMSFGNVWRDTFWFDSRVAYSIGYRLHGCDSEFDSHAHPNGAVAMMVHATV